MLVTPSTCDTQAMHLADGTGGEAAPLGTGHGRLCLLVWQEGRVARSRGVNSASGGLKHESHCGSHKVKWDRHSEQWLQNSVGKVLRARPHLK